MSTRTVLETSSPCTRRAFLQSTALAAASLLPRRAFAGPVEGPGAGPVDWLADVQRPPAKLPDDAPRLSPLLVDARDQPIRSKSAWEDHRGTLRKWWLDFLRPLPLSRERPPKLEVLAEDRVGAVLRQHVRYHVEPDVVTEAYLLKPSRTAKPRPGVVVFHSTVDHSIRQPAGLEGAPEKAFGLKLAERGYVTFSPRNFLWPDNRRIDAAKETERFEKRHPGSTGMAKMLFDAQVAVDILAAQPEVDATRLGAIGHSLGAKEVLYLAALDPRIKVTVSSEGGIGTRFSNWEAPWYLGPRIQRPEFAREHHELLGLIAPRPFLLLGGDSADGDRSWPFVEAALPVYRLYDADAPPLGLFNHRQGHAVPPAAEMRIDEWITAYL